MGGVEWIKGRMERVIFKVDVLYSGPANPAVTPSRIRMPQVIDGWIHECRREP